MNKDNKNATNGDTTKKHYQNVKVTKLPKSQVEIEGEVSVEKMDIAWPKAIEKITAGLEIQGFRKGKVPEDMVVKKVGELPILEEAGELALSEVYADILTDHSVDAIGHPKVQITKIAKGSPLGFKIITSVVPVVTLKDYKKDVEKIAKKEIEVEVTDKDFDAVIENIQNNRKQLEKTKIEKERLEKKDETPVKDEDLTAPEFNDEFVKTLGEFKGVSDFKEKVMASMKIEKEKEAKDKLRGELVELLLEKAEIDLPQLIVDGEMEKMSAQFKDDIAKAGMKFEDYLKNIKKTEEEIKKEWLPSAEKRAKVQLTLNQIAKNEDIRPTEEQIKKEVDQLVAQYKDANRFQARMYIESVLTNELIMRHLLGESTEDVSFHQ
jgi:trigger factor